MGHYFSSKTAAAAGGGGCPDPCYAHEMVKQTMAAFKSIGATTDEFGDPASRVADLWTAAKSQPETSPLRRALYFCSSKAIGRVQAELESGAGGEREVLKYLSFMDIDGGGTVNYQVKNKHKHPFLLLSLSLSLFLCLP